MNLTMKSCKDCPKRIDNRSIRCHSCEAKNRDLTAFLKVGKITRLGKIPWNKNKKGLQKGWSKGLTKETNKSVNRIATAKIGKKRPDLIGNKWNVGNHYNWKGGLTSEDKLERSKFRKTMQKQVFERDKYTCQMCGSKGDLQVDHIQSWKDYVELRFKMENCRTLCKKCHYFITYGRPMLTNKPWGHNLKYYSERGCSL